MTRKHIIGAVLGFVLAASAGALAAFLIYSGLNGSAGGNFGNTTSTLGALVVSADTSKSAPTALTPGDSTVLPVKVTNADGSGAHALTADATVTVTSSPASCATHIQVGTIPRADDGSMALGNGATYTPGQVKTLSIPISADAGLGNECINGSWTVNFTGTTS